ncbi:MAG TPA: methyltransferase domain-containing protein [Thermomicrobiales bacterium]|nr:methyltransferase domain-containing protein [Thermomicrobiales bacterium]
MPESAPRVVLSRFQAADLLRARERGDERVLTSADLGLSTSDVALTEEGARFPDGELLLWEDVDEIADRENACFRLDDAGIHEIRVFSEHTNWVRALMPTRGAPTMLVSGIPMHRILGIDPRQDTLRKMRAVAPVNGVVLDTATGLGYTAIEAARTAERVITIELDPAGLEIARQNPWSRELFDNPRIQQIVGDACDEVEQFADGTFSRIIHDPPALSLAGELYSGAFYRQLFRVLRRNGRLFHYIGDPASASGRNTTSGVIRRLKESGFTRVERRPEAFGVVAGR